VREEVFAAMDDWCRKRLASLTAHTTPMIMGGMDLDDPEYRRLLGQHQAYHHMRSFIAEMNHTPTPPSNQEDAK
jgi:hypothetical protein